MSNPCMFLFSKRIAPGVYPLEVEGGARVRVTDSPLRPGVISRDYYPAGFSPFECPEVDRGPVEISPTGVMAESLTEGAWWWNVALLSLARAEHPGVTWRTRRFEQLGGAPIAFGIVGREVVAIVAPMG